MDPEIIPGAQMCAPEPRELGQKNAASDATAGEHPARRSTRRGKSDQLDELPAPGITRWVIRRKAQVVQAVQAGVLSVEEVCKRYSVSVEEFEAWQRSFRQHGVYGLRTTRSQIYRDSDRGDKE
jgi:hypothetical protein